ncbi:MAG: multiheme c-type cytochrome [Myxococcota bacterium]|nr:multiheme c-type cytochrome [Myxococcota bacterium]
MDAGDFAWKSAGLPSVRLPQQRRKAELQLAAFAKGGIDALAPGDGDLALGPTWLQDAARVAGVPLVLANVRCEGSAPFAPAAVVERGGVKSVIAGVMAERSRMPEGCVVGRPAPALQSVLDAVGPVDLVIVLSHQDPQDDAALASAIPAADIFVNAGSGASLSQPRALPGAAVQLAAGSRGKKLGVATITLRGDAEGFETEGARQALAARLDRMRARLATARAQVDAAGDGGKKKRAERRVAHFSDEVGRLEAELEVVLASGTQPRNAISTVLRGLTDAVADDPEVAAMLEAAKVEIDAAARTAARTAIGTDEAQGRQPEAGAEPAAAYAGSQACAGCHPGPMAQWKPTPHATAWSSLVEVNRQMDLDCWTCHATGAGQLGGPQHPTEVTPELAGVGCESCHGAGAAHARSPMEHGLVGKPGLDVCTACHDGEQDGGRFDPETYVPAVVHTGP